MMLIDYSHSKNIHNLKVMKFLILKIKNIFNIIKKIQEYFTTCKWGVMTSKTKLEFMKQ
jgi:hypothetical protein